MYFSYELIISAAIGSDINAANKQHNKYEEDISLMVMKSQEVAINWAQCLFDGACECEASAACDTCNSSFV